ncbi:MAG: hypothetical protein D6790_16990 [Caldilineae bacterium]|nr:MAG: hypothetical protein D6790_16990 [Caldilineae bacterium]
MINFLNRIVVSLLWLFLLAMIAYFTATPVTALNQLMLRAGQAKELVAMWQAANPTNFLIGQIAVGLSAVLLFGSLLLLELWPRRRRGVRVQTVEGGSVELDTASIARRLEWHLDQLADVITVVPHVKARGSAVDIQLDVETAPDIDVPMKTDEVVEVTRDIIEEDMGLKLGKLDVRIRHAPFEEEWVA